MRAAEPLARERCLPGACQTKDTNSQADAKQPVRNELGNRQKDDTDKDQDACYQASQLTGHQQRGAVRAILRKILPVRPGLPRLLPPRYDVGEPPLIREQARTPGVSRHEITVVMYAQAPSPA